MIAAACRSVYEDEIEHAHHGVEDMVALEPTEEDWALAWQMVEDISRQRVRMRNEQFNFPLSEARLEEIGGGEDYAAGSLSGTAGVSLWSGSSAARTLCRKRPLPSSKIASNSRRCPCTPEEAPVFRTAEHSRAPMTPQTRG